MIKEDERNRRKRQRGRHTRESSPEQERRRQIILIICCVVMVLSLVYMFYYDYTRHNIQRENEAYSVLYQAQPSTGVEIEANDVSTEYTHAQDSAADDVHGAAVVDASVETERPGDMSELQHMPDDATQSTSEDTQEGLGPADTEGHTRAAVVTHTPANTESITQASWGGPEDTNPAAAETTATSAPSVTSDDIPLLVIQHMPTSTISPTAEPTPTVSASYNTGSPTASAGTTSTPTSAPSASPAVSATVTAAPTLPVAVDVLIPTDVLPSSSARADSSPSVSPEAALSSPFPNASAAATTYMPSAADDVTDAPHPSTLQAEAATLAPGVSPSQGVALPHPFATADDDTLVVALDTPRPVQESFDALLEVNPETVGFLNIADVISLPVVQRPNDNNFYLDHSFDMSDSTAGTLFLDGANVLVPEDNCLIIYGHNMRNGTMFQPLTRYDELSFLQNHPIVRFDTLYENRVWVPFAASTLSADPDSESYLDIREFGYDESSFELFVHSLRTLSAWDSPLEVKYGDQLLLLVTCEYTHNDGRFVLALRAARGYESELQLRSLVQASR